MAFCFPTSSPTFEIILFGLSDFCQLDGSKVIVCFSFLIYLRYYSSFILDIVNLFYSMNCLSTWSKVPPVVQKVKFRCTEVL